LKINKLYLKFYLGKPSRNILDTEPNHYQAIRNLIVNKEQLHVRLLQVILQPIKLIFNIAVKYLSLTYQLQIIILIFKLYRLI